MLLPISKFNKHKSYAPNPLANKLKLIFEYTVAFYGGIELSFLLTRIDQPSTYYNIV